jgi:hypothetical protein
MGHTSLFSVLAGHRSLNTSWKYEYWASHTLLCCALTWHSRVNTTGNMKLVVYIHGILVGILLGNMNTGLVIHYYVVHLHGIVV